MAKHFASGPVNLGGSKDATQRVGQRAVLGQPGPAFSILSVSPHHIPLWILPDCAGGTCRQLWQHVHQGQQRPGLSSELSPCLRPALSPRGRYLPQVLLQEGDLPVAPCLPSPVLGEPQQPRVELVAHGWPEPLLMSLQHLQRESRG